jgi:phage-related protein
MKRLVWLGSSRDEVRSFPPEARREIGHELDQVQQGLEPSDWKALPGLGSGIYEIRVHAGNEYRVAYVAKFPEVIYVLHAFVKKTARMSDRDGTIIRKRYQELAHMKGGS